MDVGGNGAEGRTQGALAWGLVIWNTCKQVHTLHGGHKVQIQWYGGCMDVVMWRTLSKLLSYSFHGHLPSHIAAHSPGGDPRHVETTAVRAPLIQKLE